MTLKLIKDKIAKITPLYNFYHFHVTGRLKNNTQELIRRAFRKKSEIFFIQIGSNDGMTGDPLYPFIKANSTWRGLFVEPVPYLFEKLKSNYFFREDLYFENAAINDGSSQTFYWIDPHAKNEYPDLPPWFDQVGSFKENHIYGVPYISDLLLKYRKESTIKGITFEQLVQKHQISDFDLLHIDTEGYDYRVLSQVDLVRYRPKVILYEHKCLSQEEKELATKLLSKYYTLSDIGADMLCIRK